MTRPWTPPVGNTWNDVQTLLRTGLGHDMTIPEGDLNKTDSESAINWIGQQLLNLIAIPSGFVTGDTKFTFRNDVIAGWLLCDHRTFGKTGSGSDLTGDIYKPLYEFIWVFATDADLLTFQGGATTKGVDADTDWGAKKRLYLPEAAGRVLVATGTGLGLTNRLLGSKFGAEKYTDGRTYPITGIAVSGNTPAITIPSLAVPITGLTGSFTSTNTYTPTGTIAITPFTPTGTVAITGITMGVPAFSSGTATFTSTNTYTPTGTVAIAGITMTAGAFVSGTATGSFAATNSSGVYTPTGTIISPGCVLIPGIEGSGTSLTICGAFTFAATNASSDYVPTGNVSVTVTGVTMGAPTFVSGTGTFTATNTFTPAGTIAITGITMVAPAFVSGTGTFTGNLSSPTGSFTATNTFTPTGTIGFGGAQATVAGLTAPTPLVGVTATGNTGANSVNIPTVTPSIALNLLIKI